jgi:putative membrane protein
MALTLTKNDKRARTIIYLVSFVVFAAVVILGRVKLNINAGFNVHIFATINAVINSLVAVLLVAGIITAKNRQYATHRRIMLSAMTLSVLFLVSYIAHHLLAGETKFGGTGTIRFIYYILLSTHIILAAVILPFILFTAYRALINENDRHRKLAKITWPIWFYVAVTGPLVYWMISPYYR